MPAPDLAALRALAAFPPDFEDPAFVAGRWAGRPDGDRVVYVPDVAYHPRVRAFERMAHDEEWIAPRWFPADGRGRPDAAGLPDATVEELGRFITIVFRAERHGPGAILSAFESGAMLAVVRRAAALAEAG